MDHLVDTVYQIADVIIPLMCAILVNYEDKWLKILMEDVTSCLKV